MGEASPPGAAEPETDAAAQRHRGLAEHAEGRLAALPTTGALTLL